MRPSETYFRAYRSQDAFELIKKHPPTFILLYVIAWRARYGDGFNADGLSQGEAFIGDHDQCGMSEREYRTAKRNLEAGGFATFRTTNRGTVAKLTEGRVFGVCPLRGDGQNDEPATTKRRTADEQATTNNKDKKDNKEEGGNPQKPSAERELPLGGSGASPKPRPLGTADRIALEKQVEALKAEIQRLKPLRIHQQKPDHKQKLAEAESRLATIQQRLADNAESIASA